MQTLGTKLKALRHQQQLSQSELAEKLCVTRQAISNWERDKTVPDIEMLKQLTHILNIDLNSLLQEDNIMSQDFEFKKVPPKLNRKSNTILSYVSVVLVVINIFVSFLLDKNSVGTIIILVVVLLMEATLYFQFGHAISSGDYTMIAGYNPKIKYCEEEVNKLLMSIEHHVAQSTVVFLSLTLVFQFTELSYLNNLIFIMYLMEFIGGIFFINYRYKDKLYENPELLQHETYRYIPTSIFIILIFLLMIVFIVTASIFKIENNTLEALTLMMYLIPYLMFSIASLIYEQNQITKLEKTNAPYNLSKFQITSMIICSLLLVGIVLTGYTMQ